jgi:NAD+ synthase (glutamine-hydrolysing)
VLHDIAVSDHYFVKVKTIDRHSEEKEMFDFSMLDEPVYVVNNHRVHNCTIYGDMAGGLAVISDLVKTDVYDLCQWINKHFRNEIIPWNTINKLPSAELRPEQHDQQSLPPYELLDKVLQLYVEEYKSPQQIVDKLVTVEQEVIYQKAHGRDITKDILKVCSLICKSQFKRVQSPTGIKLTSKLFKMGYRMPIVHRWN